MTIKINASTQPVQQTKPQPHNTGIVPPHLRTKLETKPLPSNTGIVPPHLQTKPVATNGGIVPPNVITKPIPTNGGVVPPDYANAAGGSEKNSAKTPAVVVSISNEARAKQFALPENTGIIVSRNADGSAEGEK